MLRHLPLTLGLVASIGAPQALGQTTSQGQTSNARSLELQQQQLDELKSLRGQLQRSPLVTHVCIRKDTFGDCDLYDTTYSVPGARCTENCVDVDEFDNCLVRNTCTYDETSGCFTKRACQNVDALDNCTDWATEAACD